MSKKRERAEEHAGGSESRQSVPRSETEPIRKDDSTRENDTLLSEGERPGPEPSRPVDSPEGRIGALETENADLKDKLLRKQADFENFRKRILRERDEAARYANAALLSDFIGLIDDFERAIRSAEESRDFSSFLQGIGMIERRLVEMLESRWGLKRFASVGEIFDPSKHEAVLKIEGPAETKPTVVEDFQKGYFLHERVLRPAKVKVMVPPVTLSGDAQQSGEGEDAKTTRDPLAGDGATSGS